MQNLVEKGVKKISPFFIPFAITNMGGALFGIETGFMGPNYSISTACATANYCFNRCACVMDRGAVRLDVGLHPFPPPPSPQTPSSLAPTACPSRTR